MSDESTNTTNTGVKPSISSPPVSTPPLPRGEKPVQQPWHKRLLQFISTHFVLVSMIITVIILIELIWGAMVIRSINWYKLAKQPQASTLSQPQPSNIPSLTLTARQASVTQKQPIEVTIQLRTAGQETDGTTAVVTFDPKLVTAKTVTPGALYKEYPKPIIDQNAGKITLTGLADINSYVTNDGLFGTLIFTPKAKGTAQFSLAFEPNNSNQSAIASHGKQILGGVNNTSVIIQ